MTNTDRVVDPLVATKAKVVPSESVPGKRHPHDPAPQTGNAEW
jgi:hypothetical protein